MEKKNGNVRKKAETRQLFTSPCRDDSGLTVIFFTNNGTQQLTYLPLIMPAFHRIMNTCQVREYPDSTISKVLTVLKGWIITMLNRKLLEKQRVENHFASYEYI